MKRSSVFSFRYLLITTLFCGSLLATNANALTILPSGSTLKATTAPAEESFAAGLTALNRNDLTTAKKAFKESIQLDSTLTLPLIGLADITVKEQNWSEAKEWLSKAEALSPQNATVHASWGKFYYLQRQFDSAAKSLSRAIELEPGSTTLHIELGGVYMNGLGSPEKAIPEFLAALDTDPQHAGALYALGNAYAETNEIEKAINSLQRAALLKPGNPLPHNTLANLFAKQGQLDKALTSFNKALSVQPTYLSAILGRADIHRAKEEFQQAIAGYHDATKIAPENPQAWLSLGMTYQQLKQWSNAQQAYLSALKSEPGLAVAYNNLAWMTYLQRENLEQGIIWANEAVKLAPDFLPFQDTLSLVYHAKGNNQKAEEILQRLMTKAPNTAEYRYHLGLVYDEQGKRQQAKEIFNQILSEGVTYWFTDDIKNRLSKSSP